MDSNKLPGKRGQQEGWIPAFPCQAVLLEWWWWWGGQRPRQAAQSPDLGISPKTLPSAGCRPGKED